MSIISRALLIIAGFLVAASLRAATLTPQLGGGISQFDGGISFSGTVTPVVLTNLRITNTGAFRITNTGANRAKSP